MNSVTCSGRAADEVLWLQRRSHIDFGECWIILQPFNQIVGLAFLLDAQGGCLAVAANLFVQFLPVATSPRLRPIMMFSVAMNGSSSDKVFFAITCG